jgi:hypothetical protein
MQENHGNLKLTRQNKYGNTMLSFYGLALNEG